MRRRVKLRVVLQAGAVASIGWAALGLVGAQRWSGGSMLAVSLAAVLLLAAGWVAPSAAVRHEGGRRRSRPTRRPVPDSLAAGNAGDADDADDAVSLPIGDAIDLHGFRPRDVADVAESYLEAAHALGLREVRLIHGRGKGVQRARVRAMLARCPLVERFADAPASRGGWGATIAWLVPRTPAEPD